MIEVVRFNKIYAQLKCTNRQLDEIRALLTTVDAKSRFKKYGSGLICPITAFGNFETPLLFEILKAIRRCYPSEELSVDDEVLSMAKPDFGKIELLGPLNQKIIPYDHQIDAAKNFLKYGRGIIEVPTRGGKSLTIYMVVKSVFAHRSDMKNALLMVPNVQLVNQMFGDFTNYGLDDTFDVVPFSAKTPLIPKQNAKCQLFISNSQFLQNHANELPDKIDLLLVDEAHKCGSKTWFNRFVKKFETNFRFGCTATMPDDVEQNWMVKKTFGSVIYSTPAQNLIDSGIITKPEFHMICLQYSPKPNIYTSDIEDDFGANVEEQQVNKYNIECDWLASNPMFNSIVGQIITRYNAGNCIVLFDRTMSGKMIFESINSDMKFYLDGATSLADRQRITSLMGTNRGMKLIANASCMGVGITLKSVSAVFVLNIRSANTAIIQNIGRGLMNEEGKDATQIIDISTNFRYSKKHAENRIGLYNKVYGYSLKESDIKTIRIDVRG
jgi:superfamily II DNA or RNA helicase